MDGGPSGDDASSRSAALSSHAETASRIGLVFLFLYAFLVGVKALEEGISAAGGSFVDSVFAAVANPVAGLMAGILSTVLVQSSSVTTATIVGLVGSGVLTVEAAVPLVMGANIGTTITNTLASLGHVRQNAYFERAFAAATVHDFFNLIAVGLLLPMEIGFGLISKIASGIAGIVRDLLPSGAGGGSSPIKAVIGAPVSWLRDAIDSLGLANIEAAILLVAGIGTIFVALWVITHQMRAVMSGRIEHAINDVLSRGAGTGAFAVGLIMTVAVQSSSITTSILVPLVAAGVLTLNNAFPVTLGANLGTTVTALLASIAAESPDALVIALAHVTFNGLGILIIYPWRRVRRLPIALAERTAAAATRRKSLVAGYVIGAFVVLPIVVLLIA